MNDKGRLCEFCRRRSSTPCEVYNANCSAFKIYIKMKPTKMVDIRKIKDKKPKKED